eukprot:scaffold4590_cov389-Prasinococcus_capsulatus_cf.AAC.9
MLPVLRQPLPMTLFFPTTTFYNGDVPTSNPSFCREALSLVCSCGTHFQNGLRIILEQSIVRLSQRAPICRAAVPLQCQKFSKLWEP